MHWFLKFIFGMKLYMFRTVPLSIIRSFSLYTTQWYMSYTSVDSLRDVNKTCMTYTIAVCTVKNSWWWTQELSETCRVSFQKYIWEISASGWFYYKNLSQSMVTWTSNNTEYVFMKRRNTWKKKTFIRRALTSRLSSILQVSITCHLQLPTG